MERDPEMLEKIREAFEAKLEAFLEETGLTEDELAESLTIQREAGR